jgi:2-dehydro-3-deoxy-D-arabinonate dehydratase
MTLGLFRVQLDDGSTRLARGDSETGPDRLLPPELTLDGILARGGDALDAALDSAPGHALGAGSAVGLRVLAPVEGQEIWAAGVTYERSRDARVEESESAASVYDLVYDAARPELFFKSPGWRARGPVDDIGVRADSSWDAPEPELALVISAGGEVVGYTVGNDVSSRSIEGENPLYLPQAKLYDGSCALGPCIVPASRIQPPFDVSLEIVRDGAAIVTGATSTERLRRTFADLAEYLTRALTLPVGAILLTGTGIVPAPEFTLLGGDVVRISIGGLGRLENRVMVVGAVGADRA